MPVEPVGVIPVRKPVGATSRRVVDVVARALGTRSVGHAGTLDPLAGGVVVVCVGRATRLVDQLHTLPKSYVATFLLGRSSPSDDLETPVTEEADPPRPDRAAIEDVAERFRGEILQVPCAYSAVHVDGKRAYRLARKGRDVTLEPKRVRIDVLRIEAYQWPRLDVTLRCSTGTFVRALGRDLAAALGTAAVMTALERTAVGPFVAESALDLDAIDPSTAAAALLPPVAAVGHLPRQELAGDRLEAAIRGRLLVLDSQEPTLAAVDEAGELVGLLARLAGGTYRLKPNFRGLG